MLSPTQRFFASEIEHIDMELHRIETFETLSNPAVAAFVEEYQRRLELIGLLGTHAASADGARAAVDELIADRHMLLDELVQAGHEGVNDDLIAKLTIDLEYLVGLRERLDAAIAEWSFVYALAGVERL